MGDHLDRLALDQMLVPYPADGLRNQHHPPAARNKADGPAVRIQVANFGRRNRVRDNTVWKTTSCKVPWLPFSARTYSLFLSMILWGISRRHPAASTVTTVSSIASMSGSFGNGGDLVGLVRNLDLTEHDTLVGGRGRDDEDGIVAALLAGRS